MNQATLPFEAPANVAAAHELLLVTCAPRLGWWAECECGWIGGGYRAEEAALRSHGAHVQRQVGR